MNQNNYPEKPDANRKEDIGDPWSLVICCGDYQVAHRDLWHKMRGFEESMIYRNFADTNLMKKGSIYGKISKLKLPIFHLSKIIFCMLDSHYFYFSTAQSVIKFAIV